MTPYRGHETGDTVGIGEVLNVRYRIIEKLGSGRYSTVWLARDQTYYTAIKILDQDCYGGEHSIFELEILQRLRDGGPNHPGYRHVPILLDHFMYERHMCLVMELMAEDMKGFCFLFEEVKIPNVIMKRITKQLLLAVGYAHSLGIIHTDMKQDNIMIKVRDPTIIDQYVEKHDYTLGEYNFDDVSEFLEVDVVLCDWGTASWETKHLTELIQPTLLRAPEVILQGPWAKEVGI
ncbi:hypothetical protein SI65_00201 [Aspergillus cristatus]|uniref:Protein kinase domain-containing protein n=1 Tax=Aspergillus cristatus TaxID=573508 RepID=A0A1E3BNR4_ASPCR|nr:hypothetical protein SI65_00201 [Aspergillus cristatus]